MAPILNLSHCVVFLPVGKKVQGLFLCLQNVTFHEQREIARSENMCSVGHCWRFLMDADEAFLPLIEQIFSSRLEQCRLPAVIFRKDPVSTQLKEKFTSGRSRHLFSVLAKSYDRPSATRAREKKIKIKSGDNPGFKIKTL